MLWRSNLRLNQKRILLIAAVLWILDFLTKFWAKNYLTNPIQILGKFLRFQFISNTGAAFSLRISSIFLIIIGLIATGTILYWAYRITSKQWAIALGLLLGGTLGNLTDRLTRGSVIDWISLPFWPTFNLADMSVVAAAGYAIYLSFKNITPVKP